jgi:RHS repeat-associated protein
MKYDCFGRAARFDYQRFGSWPPPPVSVVLTYDALGRLAGRLETQGSSVRSAKYAYGGDNPWQLLEERRVTAGVAEPPVTYVQGPGIDDILSVRDQHGELFLCADDQSSVLAAADRDGLVLERYSYDDFGRPETRTETYGAGLPAGRNAHLFTGRRWDTTSGLYDYRTRWYDPSPGRFISRDTIGIWGDPANLGNPYTYVANNPATWVDPWGLEGEDPDSLEVIQRASGSGTYADTRVNMVKNTIGGLEGVRRYNTELLLMVGGERVLAKTGEAAADLAQAAREAGLFGRFGRWLGRLNPCEAGAMVPHRNSLEYVGETHVYRIKAPDGSTYKIGESARGVRVGDGQSIRAEEQVRRLVRQQGPGFESEIRRTFPNKAAARDYEQRLIERFRSRYGEDSLPGNRSSH